MEIPYLANYFVERYAKLYRRDGFAIPSSVIERLTRHRYPGNVRELENLIKRMLVLADPFLTRRPLPHIDGDSGQTKDAAAEHSLKDFTRTASQQSRAVTIIQ